MNRLTGFQAVFIVDQVMSEADQGMRRELDELYDNPKIKLSDWIDRRDEIGQRMKIDRLRIT